MKTVEKSINWLIVSLVFLLPLFFLPITTEFYLFNKQTLLILTTGVLLVLWTLKLVKKKTLSFQRTPLDLPIALFALAYVFATIFASPNKVVALMDSTSLSTVLVLTILYFVINNNMAKGSIVQLFNCSIVSASLLALIAIYQFIGLGETFAPVDWMRLKLWTPVGGPLILLSFLGINLFLAMTLFLKKFNQQAWLATAWLFVTNLLIALALITTLWQVLPGKETSLILLPYKDSWEIAIESFKQNPLFGVGPGNYLSAFNRFRPVSYNFYNFWHLRFGNASNFLLEILTIGGILTLSAYLFLILKVVRLWVRNYREYQKKQKDGYQLGLLVGILVLLAIQLFLPINLLILTSTFIFLAFLSLAQAEEKEVLIPSKNLFLVALGVTIALVLISFYFWGRVYAAEFFFRQSLNALAKNQGIQTYNNQIKAITFNPYLPSYRRAYSQTNFALADSLAARAELTDQDRADITQLIQQAIREAKIATVLNQTDAANWENLAQIYRNLINFSQGADQWAIASYQQAIITDPVNPQIRLNLGGLFYSLQQYDQAIQHFQIAVSLKPDYANGYYNLAAALREQEKYQEAYNVLQLAVNFVPIDSADYQKAKNELEELAKKLPTEATPSARRPKEEEEILTVPSPFPSPAISPIPLPEGAGPELPEGEPEVSPSPSPTP